MLKLEVYDDKAKQKAMRTVSSLSGVDSISMDMKDKKLTVTGDIDPVVIVGKLRKICPTDMISVGPAKEEKKDGPKKDEPKKPDAKKDPKDQAAVWIPHQYHHYPQIMPQHYYARSVEEDPNGCLIS